MPGDAVDSMPNYPPLSERLASGGQPTAGQLQAVQGAGRAVVINLRPEIDTPPEEPGWSASSGWGT
jgi:protein tyrosine phosphatase (PTP) superfamily phosphohydrolase (DUF442 family)